MGQRTGMSSRGPHARTLRLCVSVAAIIGAAGLSSAVFSVEAIAQQAAKPAPAAAPDPAKLARSSYEAGAKSYAAGKWQLASDQLSGALRGGGLPGADMARAMMMRGVAYKKLSKPGLAISDLTSALWLKNGLSDADKQIATAERADAYRMAGLADTGSGSERAVVADPNPAAVAAVAPPAPQPAVAAAVQEPAAKPAKPAKKTKDAKQAKQATTPPVEPPPPVQTITRQSPDSEAARDAANARANAAQSAGNYNLDMAQASTYTAPVAPQVVAAVPVPAPIPSAIASPEAEPAPSLSALPQDAPASASEPGTVSLPNLSNVPNTVSGFFSNLFGGNSQTTAPTEASPPAIATGAAPAPVAALTTASTTPAAAPIATVPAVTPVAKQAAPTGKYKLHIAAVRSKAEADQLAASLTQKHGNDLAARIPVVDEAVIGSMGKFYRVRVGAYANPDEPRGVCNKLRTSGFDCLVVTN